MALIRFPEGQQRSGSAGGSVYSRNRSGAYIRARSVPVNPNTDRQVAARNIMRALSIAWNNTLTQDQRDAWEVYAQNVVWQNKLGDAINLTGLNHYTRSNSAVLAAGLTRVDDAPTTFTLAAAEAALVPTASEATQIVSCAYDDAADWVSEDGAAQLFYQGLPGNASKKFFASPYRLLGIVLSDSGTPPTSPSAIAAVFPFAEGNRIWVRSRILRADGRLSEFAVANFLGAA